MANGELIKDFLTGYYTREGLYPQVQKLQSDTQRTQTPFSILIVDIDHFKVYNDKYGHATGDEILKYFSNSIRLNLVAERTHFFRLGGDEFVVLFPVKESDEVKRLANRINENLRHLPYQLGDRQIRLSFSAGIASYPAHGSTAEELLHHADQAMYFSKRSGRGRVTSYGNFFVVKLERAVRLFFVLALAFLVGLGMEFGIQSRPTLENKILDLISKAEPFVAYLKREASHAIHSFRSLYETAPPVVRPPEISPPPPPIEKPNAPTVSVPPTTTWDFITLKSGRVIQGTIVEEDQNRLTLQLNISAKRGVIVLEKANVSKIVRKSDP